MRQTSSINFPAARKNAAKYKRLRDKKKRLRESAGREKEGLMSYDPINPQRLLCAFFAFDIFVELQMEFSFLVGLCYKYETPTESFT